MLERHEQRKKPFTKYQSKISMSKTHSFISPQNVIAKKTEKQDLAKLN